LSVLENNNNENSSMFIQTENVRWICGCHSRDCENRHLSGRTLWSLEKSNISDEQTTFSISAEEYIKLEISRKQSVSAILLLPCLAYLLSDPKDGGNSSKMSGLLHTTENTTLIQSVCIGTVVPSAWLRIDSRPPAMIMCFIYKYVHTFFYSCV
jgi:hypothetical protein